MFKSEKLEVHSCARKKRRVMCMVIAKRRAEMLRYRQIVVWTSARPSHDGGGVV